MARSAPALGPARAFAATARNDGRLQATLGNQAVLRFQALQGSRSHATLLQRSCECGGGCGSCADEERKIQRDAFGPSPSRAGADLTPDRGGGSAIPAPTRQALESSLGADFGEVRIHTDPAAGRAAGLIHARAFTAGRDIYFGPGRFAPETTDGQRLLAHELTHVVQQRSRGQAPASAADPGAPYSVSHGDDAEEVEAVRVAEKVAAGERVALAAGRVPSLNRTADPARPRLWRAAMPGSAPARVPGGGATPGVGEGEDVIFLVPFSTAKNTFALDVLSYIRSTLPSDSLFEVTSLEGMFTILAAYAEGGQKIRRIRLVSHGQLADAKHAEGIAIGLEGQAKRNWVNPKEVAQFARRPRIRAIVQQVMAPGAVVEFWGCRMGLAPASGQAWATLFQSSFRANTERFQTGTYKFPRPARGNEKGRKLPGREGLWVDARSTREIDQEDRATQIDFLKWLLYVYQDLVKNGDLPPMEAGATGERILRDVMIPMFDRANGTIRNIEISEWADPEGKRVTRPGDGKPWADLWRSFEPVREEAIRERPQEVVDDKPYIPTDIAVREPERPLPWEEAAAPPVVPSAPVATRPVPQMPALTDVALESRGVECRAPDSSPAGPVVARVRFASDHAAVVPPGQVALAGFAAGLGGNAEDRRVRVDGYASTDGTAGYNLALSCRRAQAVAAELTAHHGIPPRNIAAYAHGETPEFSARSRAENRVVIVSAPSVGPAERNPLGPPTQRPPDKRHDPHLLLSGEAAARAVARVLPTANPIRVSSGGMGWVVMTPGTIWDNHKMLVYASETTSYYVVGDNLYEISTAGFLRTFWFDALAQGARRAEHWIVIGKAEMAFLQGIFVPFRVALLVSAVDLAFKYVTHKELFHEVFRRAPRVMELLWDLCWQHPKLCFHLAKAVGSELFFSAVRGIGPQDVAFFLGRLLHGKRKGALGLRVELPAEVTLGLAARIIGNTAFLVFAAHALPMAAHDVTGRVEAKVAEMRRLMAEEGATMSQEEARVLLRELLVHPDAAQRLNVLNAALKDLVPTVRALTTVFGRD